MTRIFLFAVLLAGVLPALAHEHTDPFEIPYPKSGRDVLRPDAQRQLRNGPAWQSFARQFPSWKVLFNEVTGLPHRAYGTGIATSGPADAPTRARNFVSAYLSAFGIQPDQLVLRSSLFSKYHYVDYYQQYQGLEILTSRITVRMTPDFRIVLFGAEYFPDVSLNTQPAFNAANAAALASANLPGTVYDVSVHDALKVLPVPPPTGNHFSYHLVYSCEVSGVNGTQPYRYLTYVDAHDGSVLYRANRIRNFDAQVNVSSTVTINPTVPNETHNMVYLRIRVNNTDYYTDHLGNVTIPGITTATSATVYIQGLYSRVYVGNSSSVASYSVTLNPGSNNLTLGSPFTLRQTSGYYHVTKIHDHMKSYFPSFTLLDDDMITIVDVNGSCNAFYDGNSVNFYAASTSCNAMAQVGDVVYHEYGHAINDHYYTAYGYNFQNGAMDEGYADVWAMTLTDVPEIGRGFYKTTNSGIREYQNSIKVYPHDIVGEVHADGEIIAGSWWWVRHNTGSLALMTSLFTESYNGFANGLNGQEGKVFREILLDALAADDDNGNLSDGTPNDEAILHAFALHGITLIGDVKLTHAEPLALLAGQPVVITADVVVDYSTYLGSVKVHYKPQGASTYSTATMSKVSGNKYQATLPAQAMGTILQYYFTVEDSYGQQAYLEPPGVIDDPMDENIPYFLLYGFKLMHAEDFDNFAGPWQAGDPADKATTGKWVIDEPQATYQVPGSSSTMVQTGTDHTTTGINSNICAVTANNISPSDPYNAQDVDNGATTLYSPVFDLTGYVNPAISYYRWYTNEASANPRNDHWKVFITNNGSTWKVVEWNNYPQRAWRNFAFLVSDYVQPTSTVQLKFVAEDSVILGANLDGGSIVEAAVDDLYLWDEGEQQVGLNELAAAGIQLWPNPAASVLNISVTSASGCRLTLADVRGKTLWQRTVPSGNQQFTVSLENLAAGTYVMHCHGLAYPSAHKLVIQR